LGCLLDNLARLVFILNDPRAEHGTKQHGRLIRNWIDWPELARTIREDIAQAKNSGSIPKYKGYIRFCDSKRLKGILNIRNNFTHNWCPPFMSFPPQTVYCWPLAIRTDRNYQWPHDNREQRLMRKKYRAYIPIMGMITDDLAFIESFQNQVFGRLIRDVSKFEKRNFVRIE
jgi:hypothetical protein